MKIIQNKKVVLPIILFFITFLFYVNYINNGFTWLDHIDIEEGHAYKPLSSSPNLFLENYSQTTFYRPIIALIHSIDYAVYGLHSSGYHLTNILVHCTVVLLTFLTIKKYGFAEDKYSFIASLLVAVHPSNNYSVGLISFRTDPVAIVFMLVALVLFIEFLKSSSKKILIFSSVFFLLALLSKETVLFWYPLLIGLTLYYFDKITHKKVIIRIVLYYSLVVILAIGLKWNAVGSLWGISRSSLNLSEAFGTRIESFITLQHYLLTPFTPPISDVIKKTSVPFFILTIIIAVLVTICYLIYTNPRKQYIFFCLLFAASFLPALNMLPLPRFISPHYLYFTTVISAWIIAYFLQKSSGSLHKLSLIIFVLWLIIASYSTFTSGKRFQNDKTLFLHEVYKSNNFREGAYYLGRYEFHNSNYNEAEKFFKLAVALNDNYLSYVDYAAASNNLAIVQVKNNNLNDAEKNFEQAVNHSHGQSRVGNIYNLALLKIELNKTHQAVQLLEKELLNSQKGSVELYLLLAQAYLKSGQNGKAKIIISEVKPLIGTITQRQSLESIEKQLP